MQPPGRSRTARQHKAPQRLEPFVQPIDLLLESGHLIHLNPQWVGGRLRLAGWEAKIRTKIEKGVFKRPGKSLWSPHVANNQAQGGLKFVHIALSGHPPGACRSGWPS